MWPDNETADDLFGFQVHADLVRAVVLNPRMQPVTVGVFGDWGGGKTSIMRMLERDLSPENWEEGSLEAIQCRNTAVVYINTWQFEGYDDAKAAILSSVLLQLHEHKRFGAKVRTRALKLLKGINVMRLVRLSFKYGALPAAAAAATGGAAAIPAAVIAAMGLKQFFAADAASGGEQKSEGPSVDDVSDIWKGMPQDEAIDVRTFRKEFAALLKDATIDTLVVLIDDLDRCSPERIVENLEAVKLFLSVDGMAFVIGADRRIVEHAIRSRYARPASDDRDDARRLVAREAEDRLVRDYLEKLVQVPYAIPRLSAAEIETYMTLLFCGIHLEGDDARACVTAAHAARKANRYAAFGYGAVKDTLSGNVPVSLAGRLSLAVAASPLMADGLKGNPRQVKRFLNALMLRLELARVAGLESTIKTDKLVKLMILEYVEPELFLDLFNRIGPDGHVTLLGALETHGKKGKSKPAESPKDLLPGWASPWTMRWVAMEPALADTDLRDYFWVSRDRLASTFSGITMVPPIVRAVIADFATGVAPKRHQAVKAAANLAADERSAMYRLLEQDIAARPSDLKAYEPLRALADADIEGAGATFARVLSTHAAADMPGTVGLWAIALRDNKPAYRETLAPVIEQLRGTDTMVGKAIASAKT
ncbi:MAG TPA: P-loop NTPase fold protein [Dehalococcoidia bacterium]|nr:P-loop NTPase fold protein [Dehalococcoidia bacterium]